MDDEAFESATGPTKIADDMDEFSGDIQKELDENFEGMGKKNTRKKKNKQANLYGDDTLGGAFDEGADSDEIHAKKGGKNNKGKKNKGKGAKEEPAEEEKATVDEPTEEVKKDFPLEVVYCSK